MKTISIFFFTLALITSGCQSVSEPEIAINDLETRTGFSELETTRIFDVLSYYPNDTQLSIAIIDSSGTHYYGAVRTSDTLRTIVNRNQIFEIGSITKVFTSALLAHEVVENDMDPVESVRPVLDFKLKEEIDFTYEQLANHTSGLPRVPGGFIWNAIFNASNPYKNFTNEKLKTYLSEDVELDFEPGKQHSYSNLGAGFLGYVLEKVTNQSYEMLLDEQIFTPLEMFNSTIDRKRIESRLVRGVHHRGGEAENWDLSSLVAAGGIYSSAEDLVKFARAQLDSTNEVYSYQKQPTYTISENRKIALGWFIISRDDGSEIFWHNGGTGGYRSSMTLNYENGTAAIILSNISAGHWKASLIDQLSFDLLRIADGISLEESVNNTDS